jgi:hypothetical protein
MYYESNKVENILLCKQCEGKLDTPKSLPCGETICSHCESLVKISNANNFECLVCNEIHDMPKNGLLTNKPLLAMLSVEPIKISRGKPFDLLENSLDEIQKKLSFIKHGINESTDLVKEYCIDLRNNVQLVTEKTIEQINQFNKDIIAEIDEYEKELINFNKNNSKSLVGFDEIAKELDLFHSKNTQYLKQYKVDDDLIIKANEKAKALIQKTEFGIKNLKISIFDGKLLKFEKNNEKLNKSILGITKVPIIRFDSVILKESYQFRDLLFLCEFDFIGKWNLIYRASRDGFEAANFHAKCDNKPNTLVIIKSENGNVFGGFTEQTWNDELAYKADLNSFIFSLINKDNKPKKIKWSENYGIFCFSLYGPTFGGGHDLHIANQSNTNSDSYSNLGYSYTHPDYAHGSNEAKSFLAGSFNFQVSEIEVYTKTTELEIE